MLTIRKADRKDIPLIIALTNETWPATYSSILTEEQINYMLEMMYSPQALSLQMDKGHQFIIGEWEGTPVSFASYAEIAPAVWRLHKIYILPAMQGKSIGRKMIDYISSEMTQASANILELNVNRYNKAKDFYERIGFVVTKEEDIDIGNGYFMNDYVMELRLEK